MTPHRVILLRAEAPAKPPEGGACNGCGVCCAAQPCPMGMLLSLKRQGACDALTWDDGQARYRCGVIDAPKRWLPWLPALWTRRLALRWIAASHGCDSDLEPVPTV